MKKHILLYISDFEQIDLIYPLIKENVDIDYGIIIRNVNYDTFLRSLLGKLKNATFIDPYNIDIASLTIYGLFISTDTQIRHQESLLPLLLQTFNSLNVPIIELQSAPFLDEEKAKISLASYALRWFKTKLEDETIIGYPVCKSMYSAAQDGYILVVTDMDDKCYSDKERSCFCHSVFEYARLHNTSSIVWKMLGDINSNTIDAIKHFRTLYKNVAQRICFCNEHLLLERMSISELIAKASLILTTFTMPRLLDCELYKKPVAVFMNNEQKIPEFIENVTVFGNADDLERAVFDNKCSVFSTRVLNFYDNAVYRNVVERLYSRSLQCDKQLYIRTILDSFGMLHKDRSKAYIPIQTVKCDNVNVEVLKNKYRKHIKAIRKMIIIIGVELLIILILLFLLFF